MSEACDKSINITSDNDMKMRELLARIQELENENSKLKSENSKKNAYYINAADVFGNLNKLQENFKEKFAQNYESIQNIRQTYNLQPWIEAAAKSRRIDVAVLTNSISRKNRQLFAVILAFMLLPFSMFLTVLWTFYSLFVDKTRISGAILMLYATHIYFDKSYIRGSKAVTWIKQIFFWKLLGNYFPVLLVKQNPETVYDPNGVYMMGYHPHGIISVGCFVSFAADATGASEMFPGIKIHPVSVLSLITYSYFTSPFIITRRL
jgi:hypothetical protein